MGIDVWVTPLESVEKFGPQMRGTVEIISTSYWRIIGADGKIYHFDLRTCIDVDTFNELKDGTRVVFNEANRTEQQELTRGLLAVNVALDNSEEKDTTSISKQTEDTVAWIMKGGSEGADENAKMVEKLNRLEGSLESALKLYGEQYNVDYGQISWIIMNMEYGMTEGLKPDIVDLQALFAGLQGMELSNEDIALFRDFQSKFMEKSPETQAHILWFFELVNDYVVSKSQNLSIQTNPLKEILFSKNTTSYKVWISGIFEGFNKNESDMISFSKSIRDAEAPIPSFPLKTIRDFYKTNPEMFEKDDYTWLTQYYTNYPDLVVLAQLNKTDSKVQELVKQHSAMNLKYKEKFLTKGTTSPEAMQQTQDFRDSLK